MTTAHARARQLLIIKYLSEYRGLLEYAKKQKLTVSHLADPEQYKKQYNKACYSARKSLVTNHKSEFLALCNAARLQGYPSRWSKK